MKALIPLTAAILFCTVSCKKNDAPTPDTTQFTIENGAYANRPTWDSLRRRPKPVYEKIPRPMPGF